MKNVPNIVPWINQEEYDLVYQNLFDLEKKNELKWALNKIRCWLLRGKVPGAIESTYSIYEVMLRDEANLFSDIELRMMYGMVILRFVNGLTDSQQKKSFAVSIYAIAHRLGLPAKFVALRHQATHENLPRLNILRQSAKEALEWLHYNYWIKSSILDKKEIPDIQSMLSAYKTKRKSYLKSFNEESNEEIDSSLEQVKVLMSKMDYDTCINHLIPILIQSGNLVPQRPRKRPTFNNLILDKDHIAVWKPILNNLANAYQVFVEELIFAMFHKLEISDVELSDYSKSLLGLDESNSNNKGELEPSYVLSLVAWINQIISWYYEEENNFDLIEVSQVVEFCLRKPNLYTLAILKHIHHIDPDLKNDFDNQIELVTSIVKARKNVHEHSYNMDNIQIEMENMLSKHESLIHSTTLQGPNDKNVNNYVHLATIEEFGTCALGSLPDQLFPNLDLNPEWDDLPYYNPPFLN